MFRNDTPSPSSHWLSVRAKAGRRDAIGARVTILGPGVRSVGLVLPAYSYLSSSDIKAHFGLGKIDEIEEIELLWPDGELERFKVPGIDQELTLRQGEGEYIRNLPKSK